MKEFWVIWVDPQPEVGITKSCHVSPSLSRLHWALAVKTEHCTGRGVAIKVWLTNQRSRILVPWPIRAEDWQAALVPAPAVDVIDSRDKNWELKELWRGYFHHKTTVAMLFKVSCDCTFTSQLFFSLLNCCYAIVWTKMWIYLNFSTSVLHFIK